MSPVSVVGVSHLTAPVEIRERFAFAPAEAAVALGALRTDSEVKEAVLLSTCNRTELYVCPGGDEGVQAAAERVRAEKAGEGVGGPGMPAAEVIQAAVADREQTLGTGVGRGIAIPHARLDGLPQPLVAVAICEDGIEWDEIDGKPAHLVFLILTSTTDEQDTQLEILGKIARAFSDKGSARRIVGASSADDAWQRLTEAIS